MEDKEINYDLVIGDNMVKYSPLAFGSAFSNAEYLFDGSLLKINKNFEEYFKVYGPLIDETGKEHKFKAVTTFVDNTNNVLYHIVFK